MKLSIPAVMILSCFLSSAYAGMLSFAGDPERTFDISGLKVPVYLETTAQLAATKKKLALTGSGIRVKKVMLFKVNVYVAASYMENPSLIQAPAPLEGIQKNRTKALQLTFLRDVDAAKIRDSFQESLKANGVDLKSAMIQQVFAKLVFDMAEGSTMTLIGQPGTGDNEVLTFEAPNQTITLEGPNLANTVWKIWFGNAVDSGMEKLKAGLLSKTSVK